MKKLKSSLILWSILLIFTLIFFSSISIFADSNQSNELNSKLRNGSILENTKKLKEIGAILDKYVSPFDYYEETILSKNYDDKLDVIAAMLSRYTKATKEEQAEFDIYLNDIFEVLKNEQPHLEVFEFERRYKLLKGSNDTNVHDTRSYLFTGYPDLFKKFQSEDLWLLEEVLEENEKVGNIIDRYTGNTDNFKEKALSGYYKDREDTIAAILSIFNRVSDSERDILDGFVSASLSSLESDHPSSKVFVMKQRFYSITGRDKQTGELNKKYNFSHSSSSEKYLVDTYDTEDLKEEIEFETNIGKTLDSYTGNKSYFEEKAISLFYKDRQEVVNTILNVYDKVSDSDKFQFEVYVSACLSTLEDEYPSKYVDELKKRYEAISKKELLKKNEANLRASDLERESFDIKEATNYAHNHYKDYNPDYPDLRYINKGGGDCANFVSQILKKGGYTMDKVWYIEMKNSKYIQPKNVKELNHSWKLADPSPWISAKQFEKYWSRIVGDGHKYKPKEFLKYEGGELGYMEGDVAIIMKNNFWGDYGYHVMYISSYLYGDSGVADLKVTYHSQNRIDKPLKETVRDFMKKNKIKIKFLKTGPTPPIMAN